MDNINENFVIYLNNLSNTSDINIENGDEDNESKLTGVKSLCGKATKILSCVFVITAITFLQYNHLVDSTASSDFM